MTTWNTTTTPHAYGRVRRHSSAGTTSRSNAAPAQLKPSATHGSSSHGPRIGRSECAREPDAERLAVEEPVAVQLREPGEDVDDRHLRAHEPDRAHRHRSRAAPAGVERPPRARRARRGARRRTGWRTSSGSGTSSPRRARATGNPTRNTASATRVRHPSATNTAAAPITARSAYVPATDGGVHPSEPGVREVAGGSGVERLHPAVGDGPHDDGQPDEPVGDPHDGEGRAVDAVRPRVHPGDRPVAPGAAPGVGRAGRAVRAAHERRGDTHGQVRLPSTRPSRRHRMAVPMSRRTRT